MFWEEHSNCIFTGHQKMAAVETKSSVPTDQITRYHNSKDLNFDS